MSIYNYLNFGNVISFDVYPASIIGARFEDVKVLGLLDKDTAKIWIDADAMHANVWSTLPPGVPNDPDQYQYVKLQHLNGKISVVGVPWIREGSIQVSQKGTLILTVTDVTPQDRDNIVRALAANGYRPSSVELK